MWYARCDARAQKICARAKKSRRKSVAAIFWLRAQIFWTAHTAPSISHRNIKLLFCFELNILLICVQPGAYGEPLTQWSFLQAFGFVLLIVGELVYDKQIILPFIPYPKEEILMLFFFFVFGLIVLGKIDIHLFWPKLVFEHLVRRNFCRLSVLVPSQVFWSGRHHVIAASTGCNCCAEALGKLWYGASELVLLRRNRFNSAAAACSIQQTADAWGPCSPPGPLWPELFKLFVFRLFFRNKRFTSL